MGSAFSHQPNFERGHRSTPRTASDIVKRWRPALSGKTSSAHWAGAIQFGDLFLPHTARCESGWIIGLVGFCILPCRRTILSICLPLEVGGWARGGCSRPPPPAVESNYCKRPPHLAPQLCLFFATSTAFKCSLCAARINRKQAHSVAVILPANINNATANYKAV